MKARQPENWDEKKMIAARYGPVKGSFGTLNASDKQIPPSADLSALNSPQKLLVRLI